MRGSVAAALLCGLLLIPGCSGPPSADGPSAAAPAAGPPVLLIGLDGADWAVLQPLLDAGELPALASVQDRGAWGVLRSQEPMLSPILWTTIATGRGPLEHGVLDFVEIDPSSGEPVPVTAGQRRVPALWDLFDDQGRESAVVAWWATWPAYPLRGRIVSDRVAYSTYRTEPLVLDAPGLFYPADLAGDVGAGLLHPAEIGPDTLAEIASVPEDRLAASDRHLEAGGSPFDDPVSHLRQIAAAALTYHRLALALLADHQPDLLAVYYQGIDEVGHLFAHCRPPALPGCPAEDRGAFGGTLDAYYRFQDRLLGELLERVAPETAVLIVSDHGFRTAGDRPRGIRPGLEEGGASRWHRPRGIWILAGPPVQHGHLPPHDLADVAPTVLYLAGLPIPADLIGAPALEAIRPDHLAARPPRTGDPAGSWSPPASMAAGTTPPGDHEALEQLEALGYLRGAAVRDGGTGDAARVARRRRLLTEAVLWSEQGNLPEARIRLLRALDLDPDDAATRAALADVYRREDRPQDALAIYREILPEIVDVDPRLFLQAADAFLAAGRATDGASALRAEAVRHPGQPDLLLALARLLLRAGPAGAAEPVLREALEADPTNAPAMALLTRLLAESGRAGEAAAPLDRALALAPRSVPHLLWRGRIDEAAGRLEEAGRHYDRALAAGPDRVEPRLERARLLLRMGREPEAAAAYREATAAFPWDARSWIGLAHLLEATGDTRGAVSALRDAEAAGLDTAAMHRHLGRLEAAVGETAAARRHLERSLELEPDQPEVVRELEALRGG